MKPPSPSLLLRRGEGMSVSLHPQALPPLEAEAQTPNLGPESPRDRTTFAPTFHPSSWLAGPLKLGLSREHSACQGRRSGCTDTKAVFQKPGPAGSLGNSVPRPCGHQWKAGAAGRLSSILEAGKVGQSQGGPACRAGSTQSVHVHTSVCMHAWAHARISSRYMLGITCGHACGVHDVCGCLAACAHMWCMDVCVCAHVCVCARARQQRRYVYMCVCMHASVGTRVCACMPATHL